MKTTNQVCRQFPLLITFRREKKKTEQQKQHISFCSYRYNHMYKAILGSIYQWITKPDFTFFRRWAKRRYSRRRNPPFGRRSRTDWDRRSYPRARWPTSDCDSCCSSLSVSSTSTRTWPSRSRSCRPPERTPRPGSLPTAVQCPAPSARKTPAGPPRRPVDSTTVLPFLSLLIKGKSMKINEKPRNKRRLEAGSYRRSLRNAVERRRDRKNIANRLIQRTTSRNSDMVCTLRWWFHWTGLDVQRKIQSDSSLDSVPARGKLHSYTLKKENEKKKKRKEKPSIIRAYCVIARTLLAAFHLLSLLPRMNIDSWIQCNFQSYFSRIDLLS